jgi:hypothetical protein
MNFDWYGWSTTITIPAISVTLAVGEALITKECKLKQ